MKNLKLLTTGVVSLLLLLSGCSRKSGSFGEPTQLFIVADQEVWQALEPTLRDVFERTIETPQPEKVFSVYWVAPDKFSQFATRKNLVLLGALQAEGEISQKVSDILSADVKQKVMEGSAFVFPKKDAYAEGQLLMVLAGNTVEELQQKLSDNKSYLYEMFREKLLEETKRQMFEQLEQKELSQELLSKYGWTLRIQHDYIINIERPQDRFVMLRRSLPGRERWLFVHWIEEADPEIIDRDWAMRTRNKLTQKFYEGDTINEDYTEAEEIDFLGRSTLLLQGLWENVEKVAGGPFKNYSFYDTASQRIYMIDIAVYYPGGEKEPFLRQLDIMAHTFKTAQEVSGTDEK